MKNEKLQTLNLIKRLEIEEVFETGDEIAHSKRTLAELEELFKLWIKEFSVAKGIPAAKAERFGGKIVPYGPYSFNVHYKDLEIEVLCLGPRSIEENDFFESFFQYLKLQAPVTQCSCLLHECDLAIKLEWSGVKMILSFLRLSLKEIAADFQLNESFSRGITWHLGSKRSLNCCLATKDILALLPDRANNNVNTFEVAFKTVLVWAKRNGIYSNSNGYFDGTTWAILVARTCQLHPSASAATIVEKFFLAFLLWRWPEPVTLRADSGLVIRFNHLMPVMTPTFPQQNLSLNVSAMTMEILLDAFKRGMAITEDIALGRLSWDYLLKTPIFLRRYRQFVVILVESQTTQGHFDWCNLVDSKLRLLTVILERNRRINLVHAYSNAFHHKREFPAGIYQQPSAATICDVFKAPFSTLWYIGLDTVNNCENLARDLKESMDCFKELVLTRGRGRLEESTTIETYHVQL